MTYVAVLLVLWPHPMLVPIQGIDWMVDVRHYHTRAECEAGLYRRLKASLVIGGYCITSRQQGEQK